MNTWWTRWDRHQSAGYWVRESWRISARRSRRQSQNRGLPQGEDGQNAGDPDDAPCWRDDERLEMKISTGTRTRMVATDREGRLLEPVLMRGVDWRAWAHEYEERLVMGCKKRFRGFVC